MPMIPDTAHVWQQLRSFDFDGGPAAFTFRDRLARDAGWSTGRAARVIEEYRRFLLLAAAAGHPVTPSEDVDEAWHLHLTYTRSYWEDLCARVLPAPLHHGPTRGGGREAAKFEDWYSRTLASYQRLFDEPPPADIWPPPAVRFATVRRFERVDRAQAWIVRKPAWWPPRRHAVALVLAAVTLTSACTATEAVVPLGVAAFLAAGAAVLTAQHRRRTRDSHDQGDGGATLSAGSGSRGTDDNGGNGKAGADGGGDGAGSDGGGGDGGGDGGGGGCGGGCGGGD